ncbi:MAG: DUF5678 domain-containing protein [Planctomycetes bacterium]|nr:DUF5678 domain-containing protein [Planctomycetota bacterium]
MNANEYIRNRNAVPTEYLLLYQGKYVAWATDGKKILADADGIPELIAAIDAQYPVGTEFVISYVPAGPYEDQERDAVVSGTPFGPGANGTPP